MAKQLLNLSGKLGNLVVNEDAGSVILVASEAVELGGGDLAGFIEVKGSATVTIKGEQLLFVAQALLNAHLSGAAIVLAQAVEGVIDSAVKSLE